MRSVLASLLLCSSALAHEPAAVQGQIALEHSPFCEFFVVHTERGFSLLDWRGGHYVFFEGEEVVGPLHTLGVQAIRVAKSEMRAMVEDTAVNLARAQKTFYRRCKLDGAPPDQALSSREDPRSARASRTVIMIFTVAFPVLDSHQENWMC